MRTYKSDNLFNKILKDNDAYFYNNYLRNPIKSLQDGTTIIFCYGQGNIYKCIIDTEDLEKIAIKGRWTAYKRKNCRHVRIVNGQNTLYHFILSRINANDGLVVDHINGNTLDNRKCNLRVVKTGINMLSKQKYKNNKYEKNISKIRGHYAITFQRRFKNYEFAIQARNEVEKVLDKWSNIDIEENRD